MFCPFTKLAGPIRSDVRGAGGLEAEARRIAMARALRFMTLETVGHFFDRLRAYAEAGISFPVSDGDDRDALKRELLRRELFPSKFGAAA